MSRPEFKEVLLLLAFSFLLRDHLTFATMGFVVLGGFMVWFKFIPSRMVRNIMTLGIFVSYWVSYGKVIDPEVGLNFLTTVIMLKILEKETERDSYMIFFGIFLLTAAGSLFEKSLTYIFFFSGSFLVLIHEFYRRLGLRANWKELGVTLLWIIPLTLTLFFVVPRMLNPIPFQKGGPSEGEVGYATSLNLNQVESLKNNDDPVFQVLVSEQIPQEFLYWRGNTLTYTDGWNWTPLKSGETIELSELSVRDSEKNEIIQDFRMFTREDYFFTLDHPTYLKSAKRVFKMDGSRTFAQRRWEWIQNYQAYSDPRPRFKQTIFQKSHVMNPLTKNDREWIHGRFKGETLEQLKTEVKDYFDRQRFEYSVAPGLIPSFRSFMQKKVGYCGHYASALAMILRTKKIPTRLVSGFLGGNYNSFAGFYLITQNDAHVWVEAHDGRVWQRIDPVAWIAPDRVRLGGEAFMSELASKGTFAGFRLFKHISFLADVKMWFNQWDFKFYQWLEDMNYYTQEAWLSRLKLKRQWLYFVIPVVMLSFIGLYTLLLYWKNRRRGRNPYEQLWGEFHHKLRKKGLDLEFSSVQNVQEKLSTFDHPEKGKFLSAWAKLIQVSFAGDSNLQSAKDEISSL